MADLNKLMKDMDSVSPFTFAFLAVELTVEPELRLGRQKLILNQETMQVVGATWGFLDSR